MSAGNELVQTLTNISNAEMAEVDRLTAIENQLQWVCSTLHTTANTVQAIGKNFDMIIAGLMASPMGAMIKKQMGANGNG